MLGFSPIASAPFASTGSGAIVKQEIDFLGQSFLQANAIATWLASADILGEAILDSDSNIVGSGWVRENPNTPEWDMNKSEDWNQIK